MFPRRMFPGRYFAPTYFPPVAGEVVVAGGHPPRGRVVVVEPDIFDDDFFVMLL
jgi:hypothetical protein